MDTKDDGGPAFPQGKSETVGVISVTDIQGGMTLRDWFAGQALVGIVNVCGMDSRECGETTEAMFARKAYIIADAMLATRAGGDK